MLYIGYCKCRISGRVRRREAPERRVERMSISTDTSGLSRRERQIAHAYAEGASHRDIGTRLFIAPSTVRTHLGAIYRKLGVSSKIELLRSLAEVPAVPAGGLAVPAGAEQHRASIAVMPFAGEGPRGAGGAEDGLVRDIITRLAKLRSLRVISGGSVFALARRGIGDAVAGRMLGVDYLATGTVLRRGERAALSVELSEVQGGGVVWSERFEYRTEDTFIALDEVGNRIVASVAAEVEAAERNRAMLKHPDSLDAWESFHRGLWHAYRFTSADNEQAQALFRRAVAMDPTFARAHAGLSFTHFQNAFLLHPERRDAETGRAIEAAGESLAADERDPSAHWAMGRALWLRGDDAAGVAELEAAVGLSPNFALGHYALAFVNSQSGNPGAAIGSSDHSRYLSPYDPLMFAMLGARAIALFRLGDLEQAAEWAVRAATRPNAHVHVLAIAALSLAAIGRLEEARFFAGLIRRSAPGYRVEDFLAAFRFPADAQARYRQGAALIGL
jgi:TolB-like protein/DNA-binding CsgD family transcriptional regulator/Flp pilus assembly protein TadD